MSSDPNPQKPSDTELLHAVARGDREAFANLYDRYGRILFGIVFRILGNRTESEDTLQDIFLQIWQRAASFDASRGRPVQWLTLLTRSRALDRVRSRGHRDRAASDVERAPDKSGGDTEGDVILLQEGASVRRALAEIPESHRTALLLAYFEGLSQSEIADRLGKPLGTVKTHTRLGLLRLRQLLETGGSESP